MSAWIARANGWQQRFWEHLLVALLWLVVAAALIFVAVATIFLGILLSGALSSPH